MGIVQEVIDAVKALLPGLTGHTQIDYEYDIDKNAGPKLEKRFGFIPGSADYLNGGSMGFTTVDHTFQLILTDCFSNRDDDTSQNAKLMDLYTIAQSVNKDLQKTKLALPTPTNKLLLISGLSFVEPEFLGDNQVVVLRLNFNIQYRYQNN